VPGFLGWIETAAGKVPVISTKLLLSDYLTTIKVRFGINRMNYMVPPGIYAIGKPTSEDPVLVTANYKMSYDAVRKNLEGGNVWLLVLETFGVNVWCAAGKGTFGTDELVRMVNSSNLGKIVSHRKLIVPILGATGVAAHEVARRTGFSIQYAAIKAKDIKEFLHNGMTTTESMKQMTFSIWERLVLTPVELVSTVKQTAIIMVFLGLIFLAINGLSAAVLVMVAYLGAVLSGTVITPIFLPWLPGKSFSIKGGIVGIIWGVIFSLIITKQPYLVTIAICLGLSGVSAFYALNFTGSTPFTSRSGVKKEMRLALPVIGVAVVASVLLLITSRFI